MAAPNITSFIDPSLAADQYDLEQRQQMAQMLMQRAMAPIAAQEGLRQVPKISPWQGIAQLGQALIAGNMQKQNAADRAAFANKSMQALARALGGDTASGQQPQSSDQTAGAQEAAQLNGPGMPGPTAGMPSGPSAFSNQPTGGNSFGLGNLIRGSAIEQMGGSPAASAYWKQQEIPDAVKTGRIYGLSDAEQGAAMRASNAEKGLMNIRPEGTVFDAATRMPIMTAPKGGMQTTWQGNQPTTGIVPGAPAATATMAAAELGGKNTQTIDKEARDPITGAPIARTVAQTVGMANPVGAPQAATAGIPPASVALTQQNIPHEITIAPDGTQTIKILGGARPNGGTQTGPSLSDEARLKAQGPHLADQEQAINDSASTAVNKIAQNNKMIELLPSITTGPLNKQITLVKNLASSVGADIGDPAPNQEFEKYATQGALSAAKQIYGSRITNQDVNTQIASNPGATMTEKAIYQMLKYDTFMQQRNLDKRQAYYNEYQGPKAGFANWFDQKYPALGMAAPGVGQAASQSAPMAPYAAKKLSYDPATGLVK